MRRISSFSWSKLVNKSGLQYFKFQKRFNFEATPIAEAHQRPSAAKRVPSSEMRPPVSVSEFPEPQAGPSSYRKTANPSLNPAVPPPGVNGEPISCGYLLMFFRISETIWVPLNSFCYCFSESRASESCYTESMSQITFLIGEAFFGSFFSPFFVLFFKQHI